MSRKQSAVQRIRKKASTTGVSRLDGFTDPYHNGETPSCRLLVEAVQDIFPELYSDGNKRIPSSELGQLLRWQVLKRRKERAFPPAPPLSSPESVNDLDDLADGSYVPSLAAKKKKKKKRKKKEMNGESSGAEMGVAISEESETGEGVLSGTIIEHNKGTGDASYMEYDDEEDDVVSLKEDGTSRPKTQLEPTLGVLDRSLHEMETERSRYEDEATPDLYALPSDSAETEHGWDVKSHVSVLSFDAIPQESTERDEDDSVEIPVPISLEPTSATTRSAEPRLRTLSTSSFGSFDGGAFTPTRRGLVDSDGYHEQNETFMNSPTHEWVPEENAEAKTETPPGDVIKNPLSLPYLLTLNTDNGVTTTTINGKLIYAEKSIANTEDYQLGSLQATRLLMEDWLGQVVILRMKRGKELSAPDVEKDARDFLKYLQAFLKNGSRPRGIPFSQFVEALEQIECPACRAGVAKLVDEWSHRGEDKPLILNPSVLDEAPPVDDTEVDAAFDYVALEEGHHLPKPRPPPDEDGLHVDRNTHMSFFVRDSDTKNNVEKCLLFDRISHVHLNTLVETWLPCGIDEEDLVNTSINDQMSLDGSNAVTLPEVLDPEEANRIQQRIISRIQMAQNKLSDIQKGGRELLQDLDQLLSEGAATQNINILAFTKIKAVDDKCTAFKGRIIAVVKSFSDGLESTGENLKFRLWIVYLETLNKVLQACDKYYGRLAATADQRGKLPNAFVSAPFRDLVQSLVKDKIMAWTGFVEFICELFRGAALQEYITRMIWHIERDVKNSERSGTATILYKMCNDLAIELSTWTETIAGAKMGDIYQVRMTQTEQMLEQLQKVIEPLSEEYASVEKYFSTERNLYFASLRSNIVLAQGVKTRMRLVDNAEVEGMVTGVLLMWTHVRLMQNRMIHSIRIPPLPLQLKRFMLHARSVNDSLGTTDATRIHSHQQQQHCHLEVKCKRKALCILAGLVYRWLKEQFDLWRAQKAAEELLNGFDNDEPTNRAGENPKPTKSKKNKKKKTQKPMATSDLEISIVPEGVNDSPMDSSDNHGGIMVAGDGTTEGARETQQDTEQMGVVASIEPASPTQGAMSLEDDCVPERSEDMPDCKFHDDFEPEPDYFASQVFVEDGKDRIAPEAFLVGRLRHVMLELGKTGKIVLIS